MPVTLNNTNITINDGTNNFVLETVKTHVPEVDIEVDIVPVITYPDTTTRNLQLAAETATGVNGWRIVRFLPPTTSLWHPTNDNLAGTDIYGTSYDYNVAWSVAFGNFDEFVFSTKGLNHWLQVSKFEAIGEVYNGQLRRVIKSSISSTPYDAAWFNRTNTNEHVDPWIGLRSHGLQPVNNPSGGGDLILYAEASFGQHWSTPAISIDGGMCVFVRSSTDTISSSIIPAMPVYEDTTHQLQNLAEQKTGVKGWIHVKHLPASSSTWYSGDGNLQGTYNLNETTKLDSQEWSILWNNKNEILFSKDTFNKWLRINSADITSGTGWTIKTAIDGINGVNQSYRYNGYTVGTYNPNIHWNTGTNYTNDTIYVETGNGVNWAGTPTKPYVDYDVFVRSSTDTVTVNPEPVYKTLAFTHDGINDYDGGTWVNWAKTNSVSNVSSKNWFLKATKPAGQWFVDGLLNDTPSNKHLIFIRKLANGTIQWTMILKSDISANHNWSSLSRTSDYGTFSTIYRYNDQQATGTHAPIITDTGNVQNNSVFIYREEYQATWHSGTPTGNEYYVLEEQDEENQQQTSYTVNFPEETECDILIVGGGGGGGSGLYGGGGGAGGLVFQQNLVLNGSNTVKVGNGGNETNGFDSSINDIIAIGGGLGGSRDLNTTGSSGGSGGGGSGASGTGILAGGSGTAGQGNDGGDGYHYSGQGAEGGGGGGAGFAGNSAEISSNAGYKTGEKGGDGLAEKNGIDFKNHFAITDTNIGEHHTDQKVYFAGGGGGSGTHAGSTVGERGEGGLGGGGFKTSNPPSGARGALNNSGGGGGQADSGGSGIVIIRYKTKYIRQHPAYDAQWTYHSANPNVHHYGNVGIGTLASETNKLTVKGDINVIGDIYENNNKIAYGWDVYGNSVYNQYGNVGIGTNDPRYALHTTGVIYAGQGGITENTSTAWTVTSDNRIKENIEKASYDICSENIKNINLYRFNYNTKYVKTTDKNQLGFIAQDVRKYFPKAVKNKTTRFDNDVVPNLLSVDVTQLNYTMYGAVKHIGQDIDAIKEKLGITEVPTEIKNEPYVIEVVPFNDPDAELPTVNEEPATN